MAYAFAAELRREPRCLDSLPAANGTSQLHRSCHGNKQKFVALPKHRRSVSKPPCTGSCNLCRNIFFFFVIKASKLVGRGKHVNCSNSGTDTDGDSWCLVYPLSHLCSAKSIGDGLVSSLLRPVFLMWHGLLFVHSYCHQWSTEGRFVYIVVRAQLSVGEKNC